MTRLRGRTARLVGVGLMAAGLIGCGSPVDLGHLDPDSGGTMGFADATPGLNLTVGIGLLCTTGAPASITSITPATPDSGITVLQWGVRPNPFARGLVGLGTDRGSLEKYPGMGHGVIAGPCDEREGADRAGQQFEVGVQVTRTGVGTGATDGFTVHYTIGRQEKSVQMAAGLVLCDPTDHSDSDTDTDTDLADTCR